MQPANPTAPHPLTSPGSCVDGGVGGDIPICFCPREQPEARLYADTTVERRHSSPSHDAQLLLGSTVAAIAPWLQNLLNPPRLRAGMACAPAACLTLPSKPLPGFRWRSVRWRLDRPLYHAIWSDPRGFAQQLHRLAVWTPAATHFHPADDNAEARKAPWAHCRGEGRPKKSSRATAVASTCSPTLAHVGV